MLISGWTDKQIVVYTYNYSALNRNEVLIYMTTWMNLENVICKVNKAIHKRLWIIWILWYRISRVVHRERKQTDSFQDVGVGNRGWMLNGCGVFFWGDQKVLKLEAVVLQHYESTKCHQTVQFQRIVCFVNFTSILKSVYMNFAIKHVRQLLEFFKEFRISVENCGNVTKQIFIGLEIENKFDENFIWWKRTLLL